MANNNFVSTGNAGEYFVAGELERRGFTVAVPMSNVKDFDILAINRKNYNQYALQVKTTISNRKEWILSRKNEEITDPKVFYVFVTLNGIEKPEYHIVPSSIVASQIKNRHQAWLNSPSKNGQPHKDQSIRNFSDKDDIYTERWDLLK